MYESDLIKVVDIPGKGVGVIALKDIPKRTLILKESPQFVVQDTWDEFGKVHGNVVIPKLMSSFNQMDKDNQKEYLNLRSDKKSSDKGLNLYNIYMVSTCYSSV
jgi:hypothetical protein